MSNPNEEVKHEPVECTERDCEQHKALWDAWDKISVGGLRPRTPSPEGVEEAKNCAKCGAKLFSVEIDFCSDCVRKANEEAKNSTPEEAWGRFVVTGGRAYRYNDSDKSAFLKIFNTYTATLRQQLEEAKKENERLCENWKIKAQQFMDDIDENNKRHKAELKQMAEALEKERTESEVLRIREAEKVEQVKACAEASDALVSQMVEALEEASKRIWGHHEIAFIRRAAKELTGACELCTDGIFMRHQALLKLAEARRKG